MIDTWFKKDLERIFEKHNIAVFIDESGDSKFLLDCADGEQIVHFAHNEIEELEILLPPNSKLICYTDGLTEARGKGTDMYGLNRLGQKSLELGRSQNADELGQALKQDTKNFLDGGDFTDDFTLMIVETAPA